MTDLDWEAFGWESDAQCCICGNPNNTRLEPRFCYTVCRSHASIPPTEISRRLSELDPSTSDAMLAEIKPLIINVAKSSSK